MTTLDRELILETAIAVGIYVLWIIKLIIDRHEYMQEIVKKYESEADYDT